MTWVKELQDKYTPGHFYIKRLIHAAETCPDIATEALHAALDAVMSATNDTRLYADVVQRLNQAYASSSEGDGNGNGNGDGSINGGSGDTTIVEDHQWKLDAKARYKSELESLSNRLPQTKANNNESLNTRKPIAAEEGQIHAKAGAIQKALMSYNSAIDDCSPIEKIQVTADLCELHLYQGNAVLAKTVATRVLASVSGKVGKSKDSNVLSCIGRLKILLAISYVEIGQLGEAFTALLEDDEPGYFENQPSGLLGDVAVYIALFSLTSMSREDLRYLATKDPVYRMLARNTPEIVNLMNQFLAANHKEFFITWMTHFSRYQFDLSLGAQFDKLYQDIRRRCMLQELSPQATISLEKLAHAFGSSAADMADEVALIIMENNLESLRIDWLNQQVVHVTIDPNERLAQKAVNLAKQHIRDSTALTWKLQALRLESNHTY